MGLRKRTMKTGLENFMKAFQMLASADVMELKTTEEHSSFY
jgi:hypothetical protein